MTEKKYLFEVIESTVGTRNISRIEIPTFITDNLKYQLFDWQKTALQYFLSFENQENDLKKINAPTHLLFNMATGTGKTLLMAALILYYYKNGYRSFIFFVNQNNIVGKTEENLINPTHTKYLFQSKIIIDDKTIQIKKVETFSKKTDNIEIIFTSIHKLHNAVYLVKENSPYLEDLQKRNIVMLGDEAHHLNADTKKKKGQTEIELITELKEGASESEVEKSWEHTVIQRLLNKDGNHKDEENKNILLEFTATVPKDKSVGEKYLDKTIIQFPLEKFLAAGYTKEINLVSSNLDKKKRILQALLFNWYRYKIGSKYIPNFKPVILFRSKFIDESESDYKFFVDIVKNLKPQDFNFLEQIKKDELFKITETYEKGKSRIIDIKRFIEEEKISIKEIIDYIQYYFREVFCIVTNSKDKTAKGERGGEKTTDEQNKLLNSLEDKNNHIRAIFTVKRLTEGWDVLNLFDIVRMYEGQNVGGSNTKTPEATTQEIQLIGRGVRYFPFKFQDKEDNRRKFDGILNHELRVLEEFYYHSDDEHRYLSELTRELKRQKYIPDNKTIKKFAVKDDEQIQTFFKSIKLWKNEQIENPTKRKLSLKEIKESFDFSHRITTAIAHETRVELSKEEDTTRLALGDDEGKALLLNGKPPTLSHFQKHIARKAINIKAKKDKSIFRFQKLKEELNIDSVEEIFDDKFLGNFPIKITVPKNYNSLDDINNEEQLKILLRFFDSVELRLKEESNPYKGDEFKHRRFSEIFGGVKEKSVEVTVENKKLEEELVGKQWYVLNGFNGTSEEINLIQFLKDTMGNLEENYEQVFLLRNEEVYKIFDFDKGRGFQPDFLLFLKEQEKNLFYQVFIEPKGDWAKDSSDGFTDSKEGWKEKFLLDICNKYGDSNILKIENKDYKLIGLPLYNEKNRNVFEEKYNIFLKKK
ncbi:MAG: DEAD/DEAH box helicase family protein [Thermoplasmata archaeon]